MRITTQKYIKIPLKCGVFFFLSRTRINYENHTFIIVRKYINLNGFLKKKPSLCKVAYVIKFLSSSIKNKPYYSTLKLVTNFQFLISY